jgi:drug/metabolite transporter (DMT)-like permease
MGDDLADLGAAPVGTAIMSLGAFSVALSTVLMKRTSWTMPLGAMSGWQLFIGGLPIALGALVVDVGPLGPFGWREAAALGFIFFIGVMIGNWMWLKIISLMPASVASIGTIAVPVVGVGSSMLVLGEPLGWREFVALGLVVGSLALVLAPWPRRASR